jgi:hypothetical protein
LKLKVPLGQRYLELELAPAKIDELYPHEEVIPEHLERLKAAFAVSVYQRNPIIVDSRTGCVLDGTHRWAAMKALGFKWVAVCRVDYLDPLIELDSWARLYRVKGGLSVEELLAGYELEPAAPGALSERDLAVIAGAVYKVPYGSAWEAYRKVREMDERLSSLLGKPSYVARLSVEGARVEGVALLPPRLRKEEVLELSRKGLLLPPKSTRHVVPARPMGVNVPLKLLRADLLDAELFDEYIRQKRPLVVKPPLLLDREYGETILYFS